MVITSEKKEREPVFLQLDERRVEVPTSLCFGAPEEGELREGR